MRASVERLAQVSGRARGRICLGLRAQEGGTPAPPPLPPQFARRFPTPGRSPACRFRHRVSGGLWKLIRRPEATSPCTVAVEGEPAGSLVRRTAQELLRDTR